VFVDGYKLDQSCMAHYSFMSQCGLTLDLFSYPLEQKNPQGYGNKDGKRGKGHHPKINETFEGQVKVWTWVLARTEVVVYSISAWHHGGNELGEDGEGHDPDAEEQAPEVVVEGSRIPEPKDVRVAAEADAAKEEEQLHVDGVFYHELHHAQGLWHGTYHVPCHVWQLNNVEPLEARVEHGLGKLVQQCPLVI